MTNALRILPLGGLGEIGKNMTIIEYEDDILIVDAGVMFPENDMLGVDLIIPDYNYLMEGDRRSKVRAILITHGHEDHIGALPHLVEDIAAPIYATPLTLGLIENKLREAKNLHEVELVSFRAGEVLQIGPFTVEPFHVAHSIPDCVGFGITTPVGLIVHTGDYKFDHTPIDSWPPDFAKLAEFSQRGVLALLADSTNADRPGWTESETDLLEGFEDVFRKADGRIIVATFASLISRVQIAAAAALKYNRKMAIAGRSMRDAIKIARKLGYLELPDDLIVDLGVAVKMPPSQVVIMVTGSQGEPSAVLGRLARGQHNQLSIQEGDTVIFSAHPIPGNEELIYRTINQLYRRGALVLYDRIAKVHVSGHASREEMKLLINLIRPLFLIPVHGELRHLKLHAEMGKTLGIPQERIAVVENGTPIDLTPYSMTVRDRLPGGYVFVDGAGVGDIGWAEVRDRDRLAQAGYFFAVIRTSDRGEMAGRPKLSTRGFINEKEAEELLKGAEELIAHVVGEAFVAGRKVTDGQVESALSRFLYDETGKRPVIEAVVV
ncbi:MAG: ribonuclease J [Anaerolineae bacterium]|nr:ribonuclease J [Anaerolineae bacterium]RIK23801.1 MAG: ribonuclease J [Anaerolineae bacterium]